MKKTSFILPPDLKRRIGKMLAKLQPLVKGPSIQIAEGVFLPALRIENTDIRFAKPSNYNRQVMKPLYRKDLTGVPSVEFTFADRVQLHAWEEGLDLRADGVSFKLAITLEDEPRMFAGFGKKPYIAIADVEELKGRVRQLFARVLAKNYKLAEEMFLDDPQSAASFAARVKADPVVDAEITEDDEIVEEGVGLDPALVAFMEKTIGRSYVLTTDSQPPLRVKIVSLIGSILTVEALQDFTAKKAGKVGDRFQVDLSAAPAGTAPEKVFEAAMKAAMNALYQVHGRTKIRGIAMDSGVGQVGADEDVEIDLPAFPEPKVVAPAPSPVVEAPAPVAPARVEEAPVEVAPPAPKPLNPPNRFDLAFLKKIEKEMKYESWRKLLNADMDESFFGSIRDKFSMQEDHLTIVLSPDQIQIETEPFEVKLEVYKSGPNLVVHISDGSVRKTYTQDVGAEKDTKVIKWGAIGKLMATLPAVQKAYKNVTTEEIFSVLQGLFDDLPRSEVGVKVSQDRDDLPSTPVVSAKTQVSGDVFKAFVKTDLSPLTLDMTFEYDEASSVLYCTFWTFNRFEFTATNLKYAKTWLTRNLQQGMVRYFIDTLPYFEVSESAKLLANLPISEVVRGISYHSWRELGFELRVKSVTWQEKRDTGGRSWITFDTDLDIPKMQILWELIVPMNKLYMSCSWEGANDFFIEGVEVADFTNSRSNAWGKAADAIYAAMKPDLLRFMPATQWKGHFSELEIYEDEIVEEAFWSACQKKFDDVPETSRIFNIQKTPSAWTVSLKPGDDPFVLVYKKEAYTLKTPVVTYTMTATSGQSPQIVTISSTLSGRFISVENPQEDSMDIVDKFETMLEEDFQANIVPATDAVESETSEEELFPVWFDMVRDAVRDVLPFGEFSVDPNDSGVVIFRPNRTENLERWKADLGAQFELHSLYGYSFDIQGDTIKFWRGQKPASVTAPAPKPVEVPKPSSTDRGDTIDPDPIIKAVKNIIGGTHRVVSDSDLIIFSPKDRELKGKWDNSSIQRLLEGEIRQVIQGFNIGSFDIEITPDGYVRVEFYSKPLGASNLDGGASEAPQAPKGPPITDQEAYYIYGVWDNLVSRDYMIDPNNNTIMFNLKGSPSNYTQEFLEEDLKNGPYGLHKHYDFSLSGTNVIVRRKTASRQSRTAYLLRKALAK